VNKIRENLRWYIITSLILTCSFWFFRQIKFNWLESLELVTLNFRMNLRGPATHSNQVIIVGIDDRSLIELLFKHQNPWPWRRSVFAELVDKIGAAGARSIIIDVTFETPNPDDLEGDREFALSMFNNPLVTFGTTLINNQKEFLNLPGFYQKELTGNLDYIKFRYRMAHPDLYYITDFFPTYKMVPPYSLFMNSAWAYGSLEIGLPDADGFYHSIPLVTYEKFLNEKEKGSLILLPNQDILGLCAYDNVPFDQCVFDLETKHLMIGAKRVIPVDKYGYFTINYYGKRSFPEISVMDILTEKDSTRLESLFNNKLVLIGYTASSKGLFDLRPTPFNNNEAGIQIHATVISNILERNFLQRIYFPYMLIIIFTWLCLFSVILYLPQLRFSIFWALLFIVTYNIINYLCFTRNLWIDVFFPDLVMFGLFLQSAVSRVYQENREKLQIKSFFTKYVPAPVVEEILRDPARINLGGEKMNITVLFSDIVGFTSISEQLGPVELVRLLNEYLTEMTAIIKDRFNGTLDKFIGDAIVAIFGAPFAAADDPIRAVNAALAMQEKAAELQEHWRSRGEKFVFGIGVGINTGPAVVGNIGSPDRLNYTCIGDTVNVAARLESATRTTGAPILISVSTYEAVKKHFNCTELEPLAVKGKKEPLPVYRVHSQK
jgi:adenylate cyclase